MMYVITDIEWVDESPESRYLTQIAAIRVNERWEAQDSFTRLVSPPQPDNVDWRHVAFNGYEPEAFLQASDEAQVFSEFHQWLKDGNKICVWHEEAKKQLYTCFCMYNKGSIDHTVKVAQQRVHNRLLKSDAPARSLYAHAQAQDIEVLEPKHCAANDAAVLYELLRRTFSDWEDFRKKSQKAKRVLPPPKTPQPIVEETQAERNRRVIESKENNYFYIDGSEVFHKRGCSRVLKANAIKGAIYYEDASADRRPCKICNPQASDGLRDGDALRFIRLFDGTSMWMKNRNIVGKCHYHGHPGIISRSLLEKHDCLGKQCTLLEKFPDCVYWRGLEEQRKAAEKAKEKKKAAIAQARAEEQRLLDLREEFQYCADRCEEYMEIIRVEKVKSQVYKIYFVSDNTFADGNLFPDLVGHIQMAHPGWRILLRHIKDIDGRFVTVDEYHARKRA